MDDRQLIEDLLSALEYHTEQTRPIEFSKVAIEAAREYLRKPPQRKPLTDEQKRELIKKSAVWDMHLHVGWYSAPSKSFVEKAIQLISDIEAAHGIKENT